MTQMMIYWMIQIDAVHYVSSNNFDFCVEFKFHGLRNELSHSVVYEQYIITSHQVLLQLNALVIFVVFIVFVL